MMHRWLKDYHVVRKRDVRLLKNDEVWMIRNEDVKLEAKTFGRSRLKPVANPDVDSVLDLPR